MESAVWLREAVCCRGGFPALAGVDLDVAGGEILLLRGPNGAGKTTLLRLLAGLATLDGGWGSVLGCDLASERRELRPRVGLLGHDLMLYEDLTAAENLRFFAALAGATEAESRAALDRLEVGPRLRHVSLRRLSAGQRKRVAAAALAVRRPALWLLDEPHATLDEAGRAALNRLVLDAAASGATVVLATHETPAATAVASRSVWLAGGIITGPALSSPSGPASAPGPPTAQAPHA
ncbi:MAG: heme ABC exporter ATP-binding protein CcmA [Acidimicrobiia bacterium]|nr:heme ABC exporter ATP-binding protein CcmA [Acidimicrobiia bacterium]MYJ13956.1 heme ABC exporter ATP-binding protein CcmA [Acidimicrobiia bacterium]